MAGDGNEMTVRKEMEIPNASPDPTRRDNPSHLF